ncbi:AsmA family protein [Roseixanthobacter glucoisosaccharinicivorans]|uniref:AsmA family protein n=1 Tax=Roseixanthobacter glucoisosaccharinicivorans TaxID=3119923 RepID=UPI003726BB68
MQGVLITIASAVILAIVAAFAAPFVVDWTAWRGAFESQASRTLGVPVVIRGNIYADILPTPRIILRNVSIGADAVSTGAVADEVRADLSLGALVRGSVEAKSLTLVHPRMRLVLDSAGRVALPTGAAAPGGLSISSLVIQGGTLDVLDRGADSTLAFTGLELKGEARTLTGPFRLEGEVALGSRRYGTRLSLGAFGAEGSRMRLIAEERARPLTIDLDGTLHLDGGAPRFEGRGSLARRPAGADSGTPPAPVGAQPVPAAEPWHESWRLSGALRASPQAVVAETLDLSLADSARPVQLAGSARLALGRSPSLEVVLNARALDADVLRAPAGAAPQSAADSLAALMAAFDALPAPDVPARIGVAVEQLTYAGTVLRDARLDLSGADGGWRIDAAEAKLPGQSALRLSGAPGRAGGAGFTGDLAFSSEDPAAFLRWVAPRGTADVAAAVSGPVKLVGQITAGAGRYGVQNLDASFGAAAVSGSGQFTDGDRPRLDLSLAVSGLDLDPLLEGLRQGLALAGGAVDGGIALEGRTLKAGGLPLGALSLAAEGAGGTWTLSRLTLDDLAGLHLEGKGSLTRLAAPLQGRLDFSVAGPKADGLVPLARLLSGERASEIMTRLLPVAAPVTLTGSASWGDGGAAAMRLNGTLGQLSGHAAFAPGVAGDVPRVELTLSASDGARALEAAGLSGLRPGLGAGQLNLTLVPSGTDGADLDARLALADTVASAKGPVKIVGGVLQPRLAMRLDGADVAKLFLAAAPAAEGGPVPAALGFTVSRGGGAWQLEDLKGLLGGAPISGALAVEGGEVPRVTGRLDLDALSLPRLIGLWGARSIGPEVGNGPWSAARFAPAPGSPVALTLDFTTRQLDLNGTYGLQDAKGRVQARDATLELRDLSGGIGGGTLNGSLTLRRRPEMVAAEGHLGLDGVDLAALVQPLAPRAPPAGRLTLSVDMGGVGRSPLALVQSLSGQGTLSVQSLALPAADPHAIESVLADTAAGAPPDERRVVQMFDRALARGPLKLAAVDSTLSLVNGVVRLSNARAPADGARATFSGTLDLARLYLDGTLDLESAEAGGAVPGGTVSWRGPIAAPERRVSAPALVAAISMRAIERETRRLEERQGLVPAPAAGSSTTLPASAPPAPSSPAPTPISAPNAPPPAAPLPAASAQPAPVQSAPAPSPAQPSSAAARETAEPANGEETRSRAPAHSNPPRQASERSRAAAPPLAPPIEIGPTGRTRPVRPSLPPDGGSFAAPTPGFGNLTRPPALVPGE